MSALDPSATTVRDICIAALKECGAIGVGQTPMAEDITDAWSRMQWMLQQWQRKRWLVYHLVTKIWPSTGAQQYTIGPQGADIWQAVRPDKIESGFLRQFTGSPGTVMPQDLIITEQGAFILTENGSYLAVENVPDAGLVTWDGLPVTWQGQDVYIGNEPVTTYTSGASPIDYPLTLIHSMEDYNRIALKALISFPGYVFYDPAWPNGIIHLYPVAQATVYSIGLTLKEELPASFPNLSSIINLPYEYYGAILYNLALRLRPKYQLPTFPGDPLLGLAKDGLNVLRGANTAIAQLQTPKDLLRPGQYNIFSDQNY